MDKLHLVVEDEAAPQGPPSRRRARMDRDAWRAAGPSRPRGSGPFALDLEEAFADTLVLASEPACTPASAARGEARVAPSVGRRPGTVASGMSAPVGAPGFCRTRRDRRRARSSGLARGAARAAGISAALALAVALAGGLATGDHPRRRAQSPTPFRPASTVAQVIRPAPAPLVVAPRPLRVEGGTSNEAPLAP